MVCMTYCSSVFHVDSIQFVNQHTALQLVAVHGARCVDQQLCIEHRVVQVARCFPKPASYFLQDNTMVDISLDRRGVDVILVIPVVVCVVGEAVAAHVDASVGVIVKRTRDVVTVPAALLKSIQSRSLYPVDKED